MGPDLGVDASSCVVRAIKIYLAHTKGVRRGRKRLFIAYKARCTEEIKSAIISWITKTVHYVYDSLPDDAAHLFHVRAHDVCAFATSWKALQSITSGHSACDSMAVHTISTSFYLTDVTVIEEDLLKIGPLVTAQQVMKLH